jgi:hypothetical protein
MNIKAMSPKSRYFRRGHLNRPAPEGPTGSARMVMFSPLRCAEKYAPRQQRLVNVHQRKSCELR